MQNSAQQVRNISGVFTVVEPVPPGPVILVDDIVDSRWTMALLGDLLMRAGTGPVHPFAIAKIKG
jgi:ATP-dependent DNA helicase RecQ